MTLPEVLRDAIGDQVHAEPVDAAKLLRALQARRGRRAPVWRTTGAVLASAAAVVVVAFVPNAIRDSRPNPAPPAVPSATALAAVPAGTQAVSWHGVQLFVPATWKFDATRCGTPQEDTVVGLGSGVNRSCLAPPVLGLTVVRFDELGGAASGGGILARAALAQVEVDGVKARRGTLPREGEPGVQEVLVVPSQGVVVSIGAPTAAEASGILATARIVQVDANGCRSQLAAALPAGPSRREGAGERLLPGQPSALSVCQYRGLRLVASRRLSGAVVEAVQRRLDALPTGRSGRIPPDNITDDACRSSDLDVTTLDATYEDGPDLTVFLRDQACTERSPTNGSTTRRLTGFGQSLDTYALLHGSR